MPFAPLPLDTDTRQLGGSKPSKSSKSSSSKSSKGSKSSKSSKSSKGHSYGRAQWDPLTSESNKGHLKEGSREEYGPVDGAPHNYDPIVGGASAIESQSKAPVIAGPLAGVALVAVAALVTYKRAKKNSTKAGPVVAHDVGDDVFTDEPQVPSNDVDSTDSIDVLSSDVDSTDSIDVDPTGFEI